MMSKSAINEMMGIHTNQSNGEDAGKPVESGAYNVVARCTVGKHKGRVGYIDDQEGRNAIVYFGTPLLSESADLPYRKLVYATDVEIAAYNALVDGPEEQARVEAHFREIRMNAPYETKFAEFIRLCETPDADLVVIADPTVLGDTYEELLESLRRLQRAGKTLALAPTQ